MAVAGDALRIPGRGEPMKLPRDDWAELLRLLDHALDLPAGARAGWLAALPAAHARLQPALRELLEQRGAIESGDFLGDGARLPTDAPGAAAPEGGAAFDAGRTIGPYRLRRPLGHGGMAVVWLAERADDAHRRPVALKLPLLAGRPRVFAERFERERRILSALSHPHIASVLDAGVDGAQPWLALEWIEGQTITAHCVSRGLGTAARLQLFVQVLRALQYAHARLVIHRDLKPSNVLVDANGQTKLLDFGVAKLLQADGMSEDTALTQLGGRALTPQYASPEQIAGRPLGTASDVYSAGVLLYELLTGTLPYRLQRSTAAALEVAILSAHVVAPSRAATDRAIARTLAGDVDAIVQKALAHQPEQRYASAAAFADDIEHHLARRPIAARAPSRWYVASRFVRRHRFGFAAGTALVVALGAGLTATTWQMQRAEREAQRAGTIKDFLVSVFSANLRDDRPPGQLTARELLDRNVERIEREFAGDPQTTIELLGVTSEIYGYLQEDQRYEQLMARRLELARGHYGERHPVVIQARIVDVWASIWHKHFAAARRQLDEIDAVIGATRGARTLEAAEWWLARRSAFEVDAAGSSERMRSLQRALELFEALDPRHPSVAVTLANIGEELRRRGEFAAAREHYAQAAAAFERRRQVGGNGDLALIQLKLGQLSFELGDHAAAERAFADAHRTGRHMLASTGPWAIAAGYGTFLHRRGERARAHELYAAALQTLPATTSRMAREAVLQRSWGEALLAEGRPAEALPVLRAAWQAAQTQPGSDEDPRRAALLLARAHAALGDADAARPLFRRALDDFARHEPGSLAECSARVHWAEFLAARGDTAAAQAELKAVLDVAGMRSTDAVPRAQLALARLAAARGEHDAARASAEQARTSAERLTTGHDVRLHPQIWRTLAQLALQRGDATAAAQWARRALTASEAYDGPAAASVRDARELLAAAGTPAS
jgi:serine/threonine protein kinase/tetratricopeptide (TPR) repeat protein